MTTLSKSTGLSILKIDIQDLVKQICLEDMDLFKAITKEEINSFHWTKASEKNKCPNLVMSTKQFNIINLWVQKEVLDNAKNSNGIAVLSTFIKLSKCLLDYNNFQSAYAVKSALDSTTIHGLTLWSEITKNKVETWSKICSVFSLESNYENLRAAMNASRLPTIPFLGVFLCDLTGLNAAHPKIDGVETEIRKTSMQKIYDSICHYQQSRYDFKPHFGITEYIRSMDYMEEFETLILDSYFSRSKALEPDTDSKYSDSSHGSIKNMVQSQASRKSDRSYNSLVTRDSDNNVDILFRFLSDDDQNIAPIERFDGQIIDVAYDYSNGKLVSLLDDSELTPQKGSKKTKSNNLHTGMKHSYSSGNLSNCSLTPTTTAFKSYSSFRKPSIEPRSYQLYNDPDLLASNQILKPVLSGLVKRKIKSKSIISFSTFQRILIKLCSSQLECYLYIYTSKISKPRRVEDFNEECVETISIIDTDMKLVSSASVPEIHIHLPDETYIVRAINDNLTNWPTIQTWWTSILEYQNKVLAFKAAVFQPPCNLIDFYEDCTRL